MVLLICFDLPRNTKRQRRDATKFRKRLLQLGFEMKQFSIYEREVKHSATKEKIIGQIQAELPRKGEILLYELPDRINNLKKIILGNKIVEMKNQRPQLHII